VKIPSRLFADVKLMARPMPIPIARLVPAIVLDALLPVLRALLFDIEHGAVVMLRWHAGDTCFVEIWPRAFQWSTCKAYPVNWEHRIGLCH
jgi:hypothetical protein